MFAGHNTLYDYICVQHYKLYQIVNETWNFLRF